MKSALINSHGLILRVSDTPPQTPQQGVTVVQISDAQAELILTGRSSAPPASYFYDAGDVLTLSEWRARRRANAPAPVPETVPLWAFREVLMDDGLLAPVLAEIQTAPRVLNFLEYGNFVTRSSPALNTLAAQLNKSPAEVDDFFRRAALKEL